VSAGPPLPAMSPMEELVRDCLERMPRRDRDLLLGYYYERCTYAELARRFGWRNKGSAHWHVKQALLRLRERLEKIHG
jgi:DNA-directed RNA polymerase specialized sigma24 family protein